MGHSQSLVLLALIASALFVVCKADKACIDGTNLHLNLLKLYWSDGSYAGPNDSVTVKLCADDITGIEIKLRNGTVIGKTFVNSSATNHGETMLTFQAGNKYTFLYFTCEKNSLGVPILLDSIDNKSYLEWRSLIACKDLPTVQLMPCYIYTSDQQLIDLSPLTKTTGYYDIPTRGARRLRVNVCGHLGDPNCKDSSVCSAAESSDFKSVSKLEKSTKLAFGSDSKTVQLRYSKASGDDGCDTLINFICPGSPQQASGPMLSSSCSTDKSRPWIIDWYTTHACISSHLSNKSCNLNNPQYGVDIDLSPLGNDGRTFTVAAGEYEYEIGLCGTTVEGCPLEPEDDGSRGDTVACQKKGSHTTSIGKSEFKQLKYFDDVLTMRLYKGMHCGTNAQRETVIHFHCNKTAGVGRPTYQSESHCSYHFDWNTTFACPSCKYVDSKTKQLVDFSSLTSAPGSSSWTTSTADAIAYINVCNGLAGVTGCDSSAGVCVKAKAASKGTSWGKASTMAFDKVGNTISLTYTNGDVCNETTGERHKTSIFFGCSTESRGPQWRDEPSPTCQHTFMWFTSAACSRSSSNVTSDCKLTNRGYTYNFSPLSSKSYGSVWLKICGDDSSPCGADATACENKTAISKKMPTLVVESDVLVTATYEPVGAKRLKVHYNCNHTAEVAFLTASPNASNQITQYISTTVSCAPKHIDCNPTGADGRTYDLSGLKDVNWEAESSDGMKYFFSICSPLDKSQQAVADCPGGPTSSCQETTSHEKVNLGYAASNPQVYSTGTIRLHYINGEVCKHGNKTPRQTTITLNCKDVETTPRMTNEDSNCNYEIWWDTPKACPLQKSEQTDGCGVIKDDIKYDLSPLSGSTRTADDTDGNRFFLAVCTDVQVVGSGDSCKGAAVCVKQGSVFKSVGDAARMQMEADDGHIKLTYKHDGNTSVITFLCNKGLPDKQVSFLWTDPVTKTHYFQWTTSLVCPPLEKECTRMVHDKEYDFSSLIRHDTNYLAHKYSGELYYINICHRVLATGPARHCPAGAAVCVASGKTSNRTYHSLGRLGADNPITGFGESAVYIQYTDGDTCPTDHSKKLTSLIMMRCNPDRQVVGEVEAAGSSQQCRQDFILETSAACPVKASATTIKPPTATCGSIGGLDTAALRKQYKVESPHHTYYLNFCGATTGDLKSCNGNSEFGVCQVSKDSSHEQVLAGKPTSSGVQVEGRIVFNFTDGKICAHDPRNSPRNVVLTLHCNQFASSDSEPEFYGEDAADCTYHMGWGRPELCSPEQVSCSVSHNGHIVDLSALADEIHFAFPSGDLASEYEGKQYLVSVCKPLKAAAINKCPGASVCQTSSAGHQAIGYVHSSPRVVDGDKENWGIELVYNTTTHCSGFSDKTVTSIIKFTCGGYKGAPDLMDTDGCTYTFLWLTSEACDEDANSQSSADCKIKNPKTDDVIDLSPLKGHIFQEDSYKLAVCGSLPSSDRGSCPDGTAVCVGGNTSAGKFSDMQLNRHGDDVILQYSGGSSCRGSTGAGTITTMIQFVCDPSAGAGKPNMEINFDSCIHNFHWKTAYVCAADCTFDYMGQIYDFRHLSSHNQPHSLSSHGYQFKMDICRDLPISDGGSEATCVSVEKGGKKYPIAYTSTLVPHYWGEGRLALTYTGTDDGHICPTAAYKPNVLLKLTCHNSLGKPSFVKLASNCTFIFEWNTYVACHDDARSKVDVVDGIFTDPVSSLVFNISQHLNHKVEVNEANYTYAISIKNALHDSNHQNCDDGNTHACQYKPSFSRAIGKNVESYYYQDEELQLVLNSDSTCGRLTSIKAQTLINFLCNDKAPNDSRPTFIDETHSCRYLFEWESPALCRPVSTSTTAKLSGGAIAGIVIGVLVCIVVVVVIVTYKVKRRRRWDGTYEYTGLSTDDDTTMLVTANKHASPRYYNDDDDDMVI